MIKCDYCEQPAWDFATSGEIRNRRAYCKEHKARGVEDSCVADMGRSSERVDELAPVRTWDIEDVAEAIRVQRS